MNNGPQEAPPPMEGNGGQSPPRAVRGVTIFVLAMLANVLPELADGPPRDPPGWLFLVAGGLASGALAVGVTEAMLWLYGRFTRRPPSPRRRRRYGRVIAAVAAVALVAATAVLVVPNAVGALRVGLYGCPHPVELRVLASPGNLRAVQRAADAYELHTARGNRDCPDARLFVYSGRALEIRDALRQGWPDGALVNGPRPDVWVADSSVEVDDVLRYQQSALTAGEVELRRLTSYPLVLAVPEAVAGTLSAGLPEQFSWSQLWRRVNAQGWEMLRPEPGVLPAGRIASTALYQSLVADLGAATARERTAVTELERQLANAVERGRYLADDVEAMLCRHRSRAAASPVATVMLTEPEVRDYNAGRLGVGPRCGSATTRLVAFYPADTLRLERVFVQPDWGLRGPQAMAAAQFGAWLDSDQGRAALVSGPSPDEPMVGATAVGTVPEGADVALAERLWQTATPHGRLLVLLDTSGSMDRAAGQGATRMEVATRAVSATLDLMIPSDSYGLWTFPGGGGSAVVEQVPIAVAADRAAIDALRAATDRALGSVPVRGSTPLLGAIETAVEALRSGDEERRTALVVITDGVDTGGGPSTDELVATLRAEGTPPVIVVAVGEGACTEQLRRVTDASGGRCEVSHFDDLDEDLRGIARVIWSGDDAGE